MTSSALIRSRRVRGLILALTLPILALAAVTAQIRTDRGEVGPPGDSAEQTGPRSTDTATTANAVDSAIADTAIAPVSDTNVGQGPDRLLEGDASAELFVASCSGCHSIGGGKMQGPDLAPTVDWSEADLVAAIKRMEKEVGPLDEHKVAMLVELLHDPVAADRLADAEAVVLARFAENVRPGSVRMGRDLYHGQISLENGGPACVACHSTAGSGASFAVPLDSAVARLGEVPLTSAIQSASFPVMEAAYRDRPITRQEAAHLVAYLKSVQERPSATASAGLGLPAALIAAACIALVAFYYRNRHRNSAAEAGRR